MHIHTVYFWLNDKVTDDQRAAFVKGVEALSEIAGVRECRVGSASIPSERAVVDDSFDVSLHTLFDTSADHDAYQVDADHDAFIDEFKSLWSKVVVYDSQHQ